VLWLVLTVQEKDYDGVYNHLLETKLGPDHQYAVSISTDEPLPIKVGDMVRVRFDGECDKVWMLEDNKALETVYPYGVPRRASICNADVLVIEGKAYKQSSERAQ
jgi:hypothetical protein